MDEKVKTHLANNVEVAEVKSQLDENAKRLLANKQVLAWIMKYTVAEFRDYELEEIEDCIEGEPEIGTHNVYPGKGEAIIGMNTESKIPNEGEATFDIRFFAITKGKQRVKLILNIEAQKKYYVGYPIILRGLFYCSRMISEQKDTEFRNDHYEDLKKVYSIWIYMDAPDYASHTISAYTIHHENLYGEYEEKERYDLMSVIAVRLAVDKEKEGGNQLHGMLETLFSKKMSVQEKEEKLERNFGMRMTEKVKEGAGSMCNYSDWVEERAIERGMAKGIAQGMAQGMAQGIAQGEKNLLISQVKKKLDKNMTVVEIAEALEQNVEDINNIIEELKNEM